MAASAGKRQDLLCPVWPEGVWHLKGLLDAGHQGRLVEAAREVVRVSALVTPLDGYRGAHKFQNANCGEWGWHSSQYRVGYVRRHPETGEPFPAIPDPVVEAVRLAAEEAREARLTAFAPDNCQINFFRPPDGGWPPHPDDREHHTDEPLVIFALGSTATLVMRGERDEELADIEVASGDCVVLAGPARHHRYGLQKVQQGTSELVRGGAHLQLVVRKAG
jgi:alkylated DNA repair protein (DNA oxidative demethylase)